MSDFLSRLLDRATGQAPVLERRRHSLFEPTPPLTGLGPMRVEPFREAPATELFSEHDSAEADATGLRERRAGAPGVRLLPHPPATALPSRQGHDQESVDRALGRGREFVASASASADRAMPDARPVPAGPRPLLPRSGAIERTESATAPFAAPSLRPPRAAVGASGVHDRHRQGEARLEGSRRPLTAGALATQPKASIPPALLPVARATTPALRSPATPVQEVSPAPTIHVTIGRVEVRAVPAQASTVARGTPPAGPRLSLEDYLRSRAGGTK